MYVRARMDAYLDPSVGKLDTISAESLRIWNVTGTDEAIEAFRAAVNGIIMPNEDVVIVPNAADIAQRVAQAAAKVAELQAGLDTAAAELTATVAVQVAQKTEQVAGLQASLDTATTELTGIQQLQVSVAIDTPIVDAPVIDDSAPVVDVVPITASVISIGTKSGVVS